MSCGKSAGQQLAQVASGRRGQTPLASAVHIAEYRPEGIYAPLCGKPKVAGDDNGDGIADWDEHINAPNVNPA
jgi:hypothetical protein